MVLFNSTDGRMISTRKKCRCWFTLTDNIVIYGKVVSILMYSKSSSSPLCFLFTFCYWLFKINRHVEKKYLDCNKAVNDFVNKNDFLFFFFLLTMSSMQVFLFEVYQITKKNWRCTQFSTFSKKNFMIGAIYLKRCLIRRKGWESAF